MSDVLIECPDCGDELRRDCSATGSTYYTCTTCVETFKPEEVQ